MTQDTIDPPRAPATCNVHMMRRGTHAIPKTCKSCGLGPCGYYTREVANAVMHGWCVGVSAEGPGVAPFACPMPDVPPAKADTDPPFDGRPMSEQLNAPLSDPNRKLCDVAPYPWQCTRNPGHLGACAAVPDWESEFIQTRTAIGSVIADALRDADNLPDAPEIDAIAESIIAKLRPELIPVAKPAVKQTTMDGQAVRDYLNARAALDRMNERTTWTGSLKNKYSRAERMDAANAIVLAYNAVLASEKEVE